jgi:hypothetical protein
MSKEECIPMSNAIWLAVVAGITTVAAIVRVARTRLRRLDLGSVSDRWVATYRVEPGHTVNAVPDHTILIRIRAEYLEMPGLHLTLDQMQRLCGVERNLCQQVIDALVATQFLRLKPNGAYARVTDGAVYPRPHAAKADRGDGTGALKLSA